MFGWAIFFVLVLILSAQLPRAISHAFYLTGVKFYLSGRYHAAAAAFEGSVLLRPTFARGYVELGSSYLELRKHKSAERAFAKASGIQDDSCAACGLAMSYSYQHRYDEAEKTFAKAMRLNPNDTCAYRQSGMMYYDQERYEEAIVPFKQAIRLEPDKSTYFLVGNSYVWLKQYQAGVEAYQEALRLDPKYAAAHRQLAIAFNYLERNEQAIEEYKRAIDLNPEDVEAHWALGLLYESMNNKQGVAEEFRTLQAIDADVAASLLERSALLQGREIAKERLYFIPVGKLATRTLNTLLKYYWQRAGLRAISLPAVSLESSVFNRQRGQVIAEEAIELMKRKYPELAMDPNAILIGVTQEDMYIRKKQWSFAFSYRTDGHFAVVSSAHMGYSADGDLVDSRLRKMVMKDIGLLFYRLPESDNPKSVLYHDISEVEDFDRMDANEIDRWNHNLVSTDSR
jgi:tetratricopeptide (TPR) repeat protein